MLGIWQWVYQLSEARGGGGVGGGVGVGLMYKILWSPGIDRIDGDSLLQTGGQNQIFSKNFGQTNEQQSHLNEYPISELHGKVPYIPFKPV